jgi:hypothetical protein
MVGGTAVIRPREARTDPFDPLNHHVPAVQFTNETTNRVLVGLSNLIFYNWYSISAMPSTSPEPLSLSRCQARDNDEKRCAGQGSRAATRLRPASIQSYSKTAQRLSSVVLTTGEVSGPEPEAQGRSSLSFSSSERRDDVAIHNPDPFLSSFSRTAQLDHVVARRQRAERQAARRFDAAI